MHEHPRPEKGGWNDGGTDDHDIMIPTGGEIRPVHPGQTHVREYHSDKYLGD